MNNNRNVSYNGNFKYEWEQCYEDLTIYIKVEENTKKNDVTIDIKPKFIYISVNNKIWKGDLYSVIDTSESFWFFQDQECEIHLTKSQPGKVWEYVFKGDEEISQLQYNDEKKKLLLERFQNEHPGFDFSDAEINGTVPEPRTFMKN